MYTGFKNELFNLWDIYSRSIEKYFDYLKVKKKNWNKLVG